MTGKVTPLEPMPQSADPQFRSFTSDFEQRFFQGAEQVKVEVVLMRETWDELLALIQENEWTPNEGLVILLATGMAFHKGERALNVTQGADGLSAEDVKKLLDRQMVIEARYASIKNFAFDIMRDHRVIEMKHAPIEREYLHYKAMVWPLQSENEALKAEVARLKQELQTHAAPAEASAAAQAPTFWGRLLGRLRDRSHGR